MEIISRLRSLSLRKLSWIILLVATATLAICNLATLWYTLNYLREELDRPIIINSAYRTPAVNKQVGGSKRSLHMQGRAADIRTEPKFLGDLWKIVEQYDAEYGLSEKILYPTFIHIAI